MKKGLYLFLIVAAAFIIRAIGVNFGLPFVYHDDEPILVNYALAYGTGDFNPHFFNIAPLLTYILFALYGFLFIIGRAVGYFHAIKDFAYLYLNNPALFYIIGRMILGVFCGTLSVLALYFMGKRYFNKTTALLAAFFLAFNFLHVRDSHYIYFDIPLTLCVLIFFLKAHDFFKPVRRIDYIQFGALFGLAISVKYQGIFLSLPFFVIIVYNAMISKNLSLSSVIANVVWCCGAFLAVVFISNPFLFINFTEFINSISKFPYIPVSPLFHLKISLFNGCGAVMVIFGIIGITLAMINKNKAVIIVIFVIFYYALITKATQPGERIVLPIVPLVLLFAASTVTEIYSAIKNKTAAMAVSLLLILILAYPSLALACYSDLLFLREDTRTEAYKWIKDNIPASSRIALDATSSGFPRIEKDKSQIKELAAGFGSTSFRKPVNSDDTKLRFMLENPFYPKKTYHVYYLRGDISGGFLSIYPGINASYPGIKSNKIGYVLLSGTLASSEYSNFVDEVEKHSTLLKTFSPYSGDISRIKSLEAASVPAAAFLENELRDRKRYGPYMRVYRINNGG